MMGQIASRGRNGLETGWSDTHVRYAVRTSPTAHQGTTMGHKDIVRCAERNHGIGAREDSVNGAVSTAAADQHYERGKAGQPDPSERGVLFLADLAKGFKQNQVAAQQLM